MATNAEISVRPFRSTRRDAVSLWHTLVSFVQLDKQITPSQLAQAVNTSVSRSFRIKCTTVKTYFNKCYKCNINGWNIFLYYCIMIIWEKARWGETWITLSSAESMNAASLWFKNDSPALCHTIYLYNVQSFICSFIHSFHKAIILFNSH